MKLAVSLGDPNGIGIEIFIKAVEALDRDLLTKIDFYLAGNLTTISDYIYKMGYKLKFDKQGFYINDKYIKVIDIATASPIEFGKISLSAGKLSAAAVEYALEYTINKTYDAMLTLPVSKESLYKAGWKYPGHTEMLAAGCNTDKPLMILCTREMRVALATVHIPVSEVPQSLSIENIVELSVIFNKALKLDYGIGKPKVALLGLNPHAGENGNIGKEEIDIIIPAIEILRQKEIIVEGPFPSDGFFAHGAYRDFDGILAMYHDQGLIPLKMSAQGAGVNVTAGLPIIRTSPDHGTAFAIAGKNIADHRSTLEAIEMAYEFVQNRRRIFD
jgi:4-hydroxythreonine-4-phosphate dehydrogenase